MKAKPIKEKIKLIIHIRRGKVEKNPVNLKIVLSLYQQQVIYLVRVLVCKS